MVAAKGKRKKEQVNQGLGYAFLAHNDNDGRPNDVLAIMMIVTLHDAKHKEMLV
jgi:hypothetical protein